MPDLIQFAKDTKANWLARNSTLPFGMPAFESDTGLLKISDGVTPYADLPYAGGLGPESLAEVAKIPNKLDATGQTANAVLTTDADGKVVADGTLDVLPDAPATGIYHLVTQEGTPAWETNVDAKAILGVGPSSLPALPAGYEYVTRYDAQADEYAVVGVLANRAPALGALPDVSGAPGAVVTVDVAAAASDPDGDTLTYALTTDGAATVQDNGDGTFDVALPGAAATETLTATATDPDGLSVSVTLTATTAASASGVSKAALSAWYEANGTAVLVDRTGTYTSTTDRGTPTAETDPDFGDVVRFGVDVAARAPLGDETAEEVTLYFACRYRRSGDAEPRLWSARGEQVWQLQEQASTNSFRFFAQGPFGTEGGGFSGVADGPFLVLVRRRDTGTTTDDGAGGQRPVYALEARRDGQASWITLVADARNRLGGGETSPDTVVGDYFDGGSTRRTDVDVRVAARFERALSDAEADELLTAPPAYADLAA